jgi:hypothetical protein
MANDETVVAERWDDFVASLNSLNTNILIALQKAQEATLNPAAQTAPETREILKHLKAAIRVLDIDGADAALERLQQVSLDSYWRERTTAIASMVLLARFDEAIAAIEALESMSSTQRRGVKT